MPGKIRMEKGIGAFNEDVSNCWTAEKKRCYSGVLQSWAEWPADAPTHACKFGLWPFSAWPTWHLASAEGYYWGCDFSWMKSPSPVLKGWCVPHKHQLLLLLGQPYQTLVACAFGPRRSYRLVCPVACISFLRTYWRTVGTQLERHLRAELFSVLRLSHQLHQVQGLQQPQVLPGPISGPYL